MKRSFAGLLVMGLVAFTGCNQGTSTPGGPGAANPSAKTDDTFTLSAPGSTTLKQGETKQVLIAIKRGTHFQEDVVLKVGDVPKGVSFTHPSSAIKHGETEAKVMLTAADDASLGDFTIKVIGHPTKGGDATTELKVTVEKK
jgi:hypothetical protein